MHTIAGALDAIAENQTVEDARGTYDLANLFRAQLPKGLEGFALTNL